MPGWSVQTARTKVPTALTAIHDGRCGVSSGTFHAGCPRCRWLMRDRQQSLTGRVAMTRANARSRALRRTRTTAEADNDFARLRPDGKTCRGCGEMLPANAFLRMAAGADGRQAYCDRNGCRMRHQKLKRDRALHALWRSLGIDPHTCAYCQAAPAEDLEHFHPRARGGTDDPSNLFPACPRCNRGPGGKFDADPFEWLTANYPHRVEFFRALFPLETTHDPSR